MSNDIISAELPESISKEFSIDEDKKSFVYLTEMANGTGKKVADYLRIDSTKAYLKELSLRVQKPISFLILVVKGGSSKQGVWAHPEIANDFTKWLTFSKNKTMHRISESSRRDSLASSLNGRTEFPCESGFVDIVTQTQLIEVKDVKMWKSAIGQILVYACELRTLKPRIHLFGCASTKYKNMIIYFCSQLSVIVTFED